MENKSSIIFIVIAGTIAMIGLVAAIILFVIAYRKRLREKEDEHRLNLMEKEREMLFSVINAQEAEREKIARNIHDEIGPLAGLLKMNMSTKVVTEQVDLKKEIEITDLLMENIRSASHDLAPSVLRKNGLSESLRFFISNINDCEANFTCNLAVEHPIQHSEKAINIYRIVLELLKNALKYDRPQTIELELNEENNHLFVSIKHDGTGISNDEFRENISKKMGLGLESIQLRTLLLKGEINYFKGSPASVQLIIPING
jgi:two-component system NarL family sensor kinase